VLKTCDGSIGSLTMIGMVSPGGGKQTMLMLVSDVTEREFLFDHKEYAHDFFVR